MAKRLATALALLTLASAPAFAQSGALTGGLLGAGAGAIIGGAASGSAGGALAGGVIGGAAGAIVGSASDNQARRAPPRRVYRAAPPPRRCWINRYGEEVCRRGY